MAEDPAIDIMCFLPRKEEGEAAVIKKYILPLEKAKAKVAELLEKVAKGEIDEFSVCLSEMTLKPVREATVETR